ncbi:MAG: hypothetical protein E6Q97_26480 [Desulfurellales bacterium]|nr:MAG: hypothetical protein E6Q97_26480 [Desulfurellales bacterium]
MKTVTDAFKAAQAASTSISLRRVSYKRRYWVEASKSYAWEGSWTVLPSSDIVSVSPVTAKLDTEAVNEYKVSNVTLQLKNADRRWAARNPFGRFAKDSGSPYYGYEPFWTKFKIETGYTVEGVDTYVPLFVGVAVDFQTDGYSDNCQISVQGLEAMLINADAEKVSTAVDDETPSGTVNGTNKDFTTVNPGVGVVSLVTVDGFAKTAGTEYTLGQMDDPTLGAKVTFATAPTGGQVVKVSYRYWKQNKSIESLVSDLLLEAGIGLGSQSINSVLFPVGINNTLTLTSQADFLAGSVQTKTDLLSSPGDIKINRLASGNGGIIDNFDDGDYTASPAWSVYSPTASFSVVSGSMRIRFLNSGGGGFAYTAHSGNVGVWDYKVRFSGNLPTGALGAMSINFVFMCSSAYGSGVPQDGYFVRLYKYPSGSLNKIFLYKFTGPGAYTLLAGADFTLTAGTTYALRVSRTTSGEMAISVDGVQKILFTDTTYSTASNIFLWFEYSTESGTYTADAFYDDIKFSNKSVDATWESAVLDFGATPTQFGKADITKTVTGAATVTAYTAGSADGISFDSYSLVSSEGNVASALKRYMKVKLVLSEDSVDNTTATAHSFALQYKTSTTAVRLAKFTGKTVYDAIQDMGAFSNYEWGFDTNEVFFFRQKETSAAIDQALTSGTNLSDVSAINEGFDRVFHEVQAEYGAFKVTVSDNGLFPAAPAPRFGKRRFTIGSADILVANDTDVATGIAIQFFEFLSQPRRTLKAKTKMMEWLDLSDTVSVTYRDAPGPWWLGDTDVDLGDQTNWLHGPEANTIDGFVGKVVGYRHDTENKVSEFDIEEII